MKLETQRWIDAGFILTKNPDAIVNCPECNIGILIVKDEPIGDGKIKFDRYLVCSNCRKWNVITMQYPQL